MSYFIFFLVISMYIIFSFVCEYYAFYLRIEFCSITFQSLQDVNIILHFRILSVLITFFQHILDELYIIGWWIVKE